MEQIKCCFLCIVFFTSSTILNAKIKGLNGVPDNLITPSYLSIDFDKMDLNQKQVYHPDQPIKYNSSAFEYCSHFVDIVYSTEINDLLKTQQVLRSEINSNQTSIKIILIVSLLVVCFLVLEIAKRKKRNEKLLKEYQPKSEALITKKTSNKIKSEKLSISQSVVQEIILKVEDFESKNGFLDKGISANKLAREMGTNSNYLGQVIKYRYDTSFRQYINNLRIEYILKEIKLNHKMAKYSIQAIATEAGYNHAEPFSRAFKSRTGYYPSEFITKIKK